MAIPKVIHYCWLSGGPYPELVLKCMESWHACLPDYEFVLWDKEKVSKEIQSTWVDSAMAAKKWAFAADYIRLFALYNYGGVYLDCDVEVLKSFDSLLDRHFFLGQESHKNVIEAAVLGAEAKLDWTKKALEWYENKNFDIAQLNNPSIAIPVILKKVFEDFEDIEIFEKDYFSPKDNRTGCLNVTGNTYTIHYFDGNWFSDYQREYFRIRVKYSQKYGRFVGFIVASCFSLRKKMKQNLK